MLRMQKGSTMGVEEDRFHATVKMPLSKGKAISLTLYG